MGKKLVKKIIAHTHSQNISKLCSRGSLQTIYFQCYKQLEIESPDFCYRMKLKNISWGSCTYKANLENGYNWGHFNINKRKDNAKYVPFGMNFFSKSLSSKITTKQQPPCGWLLLMWD